MFVIGELHRNLSEVVTIQIPERQTETERRFGNKRVKRRMWKRRIGKEREREKGENEAI